MDAAFLLLIFLFGGSIPNVVPIYLALFDKWEIEPLTSGNRGITLGCLFPSFQESKLLLICILVGFPLSRVLVTSWLAL